MLNDGQRNSLSEMDYDSIEILIEQHEVSLYNLCSKLYSKKADAEDLYQQTWLKVIQNIDKFSQKSFKNWLYTICFNIYKDNYRKSKRREKITSSGLSEKARDYVMSTATDDISAEGAAISNLVNSTLMIKVNTLPYKHRMPIILFYFEGLDYNECAKILRVPIGTIKSRLNNAKKKLKAEMEDELND